MSYLLDTHALLWWLEDSPTLHADARAVIEAPGNDVAVSAASMWEASIKRAVGKLNFETERLLDALAQSNIRLLSITARDALAAGDLPRHHDDPFDRMLVAQAIARQLTIVTRDPWIGRYELAIVRA